MHIGQYVVEVARYYGELKAKGVPPVQARERTRKIFGFKRRGTVLWCEEAAKPAGKYVNALRKTA